MHGIGHSRPGSAHIMHVSIDKGTVLTVAWSSHGAITDRYLIQLVSIGIEKSLYHTISIVPFARSSIYVVQHQPAYDQTLQLPPKPTELSFNPLSSLDSTPIHHHAMFGPRYLCIYNSLSPRKLSCLPPLIYKHSRITTLRPSPTVSEYNSASCSPPSLPSHPKSCPH